MRGSQTPMDRYIERAGLAPIWEKVQAGERLSFEDGVRLYESSEATAIGAMANWVREARHGDVTYFVRNQHVNYTNICNKDCKFCSFFAKKGGPDPYELDVEAIRRRVREYVDVPITEIHMVGGINPRLPYSYYLQIVRAIKEERPNATVKAFTMIELQQIARKAEKPLEEVLRDLMEAGLGALPGGGAEVLTPRVHEILYNKKLDWRDWLETARVAHSVGLKSNATMLYGHIETLPERVEHLVRLRELQDETGGFLSFIPLAFDPQNTQLADVPRSTGVDDLKTIAISRLMLDNFPHIKAFWMMITPPVAQLSLRYGANDFDGTIMNYEITHVIDRSNRQSLTLDELLELIREAGRVPVERDALYNVVHRWDVEGLPAGARPPARVGLPVLS
ncbi:MAG: aminofutalosine synthase MqnE [Armatimonadota bacterium]